jgi:cell wall-associated NlpC family hydrolase
VADPKLTIRILGDASKARKEIGGLQSTVKSTSTSIGDMASGMVAGLAALGVGRFLQESVQYAKAAEVNITRLKTAVEATGTPFAIVSREIETTIGKLSSLSGFSRGEFRSALADLTLMTGNENVALKDMALVSDIARARKMSLADAAKMLGKVEAGNFLALKRLGFQIDANMTKEEVLAMLRERMAGQAEAFGKTAEGAQMRWENSVKALQVSIGKGLLPMLTACADKGSELVEGFNAWPDGLRQATVGVGSLTLAVMLLNGALGMLGIQGGLLAVGKGILAAGGGLVVGMSSFWAGLTSTTAAASVFTGTMGTLGGVVAKVALGVAGFVASIGALVWALALLPFGIGAAVNWLDRDAIAAKGAAAANEKLRLEQDGVVVSLHQSEAVHKTNIQTLAAHKTMTERIAVAQSNLAATLARKTEALADAAQAAYGLRDANNALNESVRTYADSQLAVMSAEDKLTEDRKKLGDAEKELARAKKSGDDAWIARSQREVDRMHLQIRKDIGDLDAAKVDRDAKGSASLDKREDFTMMRRNAAAAATDVAASTAAVKASTTEAKTVVGNTVDEMNRKVDTFAPNAGRAGVAGTSALRDELTRGAPGPVASAATMSQHTSGAVTTWINGGAWKKHGAGAVQGLGEGIESPTWFDYAVGAASSVGQAILKAIRGALGLGGGDATGGGPHGAATTSIPPSHGMAAAGSQALGTGVASLIETYVPNLKPLLDLGLSLKDALGGTGSGNWAAGLKLMMEAWGKDYVWGAAGPNVFDCSGLVSAVLARIFPGRYGRFTSGEIGGIFAPGPGRLMTIGWNPGHTGIADLMGHRGEARGVAWGVLGDGAARGPGDWDQLYHVPGFEQGGIVYGPTLGLLAEAGDAKRYGEVVAPLNKLTAMISDAVAPVVSRVANHVPIYLTANIGSDYDVDRFVTRLQDKLETEGLAMGVPSG